MFKVFFIKIIYPVNVQLWRKHFNGFCTQEIIFVATNFKKNEKFFCLIFIKIKKVLYEADSLENYLINEA